MPNHSCNFNYAIIGAGVVGLAIARALARAGHEVVILEKAEAFGTETSSRNSEVIHAGIYYDHNSLMARLCVEGKGMLYGFCASHGVDHKRCGKWIVATSDAEAEQLSAIKLRAERNGVDDLKFIDGADLLQMEPELRCKRALLSPSTGIIDSHGYMQALLGDAEAHGAMLALHAPVLSGRIVNEGVELKVGGKDPTTLTCRMCINAAGLHAPDLAATIAGFPAQHIPKPYYAKGNYFSLLGKTPFSRLIYPVPVPGGLGTHLTLDLAGRGRFGPDVEWVEGINYDVDPARGELFYSSIRRYWPGLRDGQLQPAYAGIRPKIVPPHIAKQDFMIQGPEQHGVQGLINLFGIESPGLTASLAIAQHVAALLA